MLTGELTEGQGTEEQAEVTQGDVPEPAGDDQGDDDDSEVVDGVPCAAGVGVAVMAMLLLNSRF